MPSEAEWRLVFESQTSDEALALLLPWRATGCGLWPLTELPAEVAAGVDDGDFRKRLTGTTWTIAREPQKESVKNGRFNVTVDLIYELTFESRYGPRSPFVEFGDNPVYIGVTGMVVIGGLPSSMFVPLVSRPAGPVVELQTSDNLVVAGIAALIDQTVRIPIPDSTVLQIEQPGELVVASFFAGLEVEIPEISAGPVVDLALSQELQIPGANPTL